MEETSSIENKKQKTKNKKTKRTKHTSVGGETEKNTHARVYYITVKT
jgi:hypothetical protein